MRRALWLVGFSWAQALLPFPPVGARYISLPAFLERVSEASLQLATAATAFRSADWDVYQAYANFLPALGASASLTQNYGTTFDPFAFSRVQQTTTFGSASLSANLVLFAGLANHYLLRQAKYARLAAHASYKRIQVEVLAQALLQFFQTLADSAAIMLQAQRIARLEAQIARLEAQVGVGQTLDLELASLQAQKAREEAQYVSLYNRHRENKLVLLQLMRWDGLSPDSIEFTLGLEVPLENFDHSQVVAQALQYAPELEEARFRTLVQTYALRAARSRYWPQLNASASIQTSYSSNAGDIQFVGGQIVRSPWPLERQVRENFNQSIFLSLSVPIFQRFQVRSQVVRTEASRESASINELQQRQTVLRRVESAYLAWQNAVATLSAAERSYAAAEKAYKQAQAQYESGRLSYWAYREALSNYTQAELDRANAALDLQLRTLLLLAYTGRYSSL